MTAMRIVYFRRAEEELTRVHLYNARARSPVWGNTCRFRVPRAPAARRREQSFV